MAFDAWLKAILVGGLQYFWRVWSWLSVQRPSFLRLSSVPISFWASSLDSPFIWAGFTLNLASISAWLGDISSRNFSIPVSGSDMARTLNGENSTTVAFTFDWSLAIIAFSSLRAASRLARTS